MGLVAKDSGGNDFTPPPQGTHPAVCCAVIDLGTQYSEKWKKQSRKVLLGWELDCDERGDGEPHVAWRRYTTSLHAKAGLRSMLEAWRGRNFTAEELAGFDLRNILGKGCIVTVTHNERDGVTYANVASVGALPKKMAVPTLRTKPILFDVDAPDMEVFAAFREKLQEVIKASAEWKERAGGDGVGEPAHGLLDDDPIPF
jgi:hypothetical protein